MLEKSPLENQEKKMETEIVVILYSKKKTQKNMQILIEVSNKMGYSLLYCIKYRL